jgi:membrane associated rhomboid family serine protease
MSVKEIMSEIKTQIVILGSLIGIMWGLEILDQAIFNHGLDTLGILPRQAIGLRGILFAPFLHGNFPHLIANTIPFLTLGWLVMTRNNSDFVVVSLISMAIGGLGTWLFGSNGLHIGASGVIFGYLGYLLTRCYFDRKFSSGAIALFVGVTYGSVLWGVFPSSAGISWEGHLFGAIGGIVSARLLAR